MKKILFFILALACFSCNNDDEASVQAEFDVECLPSNLQNGVIAFYPFDNGSLRDASGNTNDLVNTTTATSAPDRNDIPNCAYEFENTQSQDEFLTTANSDYLNNLNSFSVSLWYQPTDENSDGKTLQGLFSRGNAPRCPDRMGEWSLAIFDCSKAVFGHDNSVWSEEITDIEDGCEGEIEARLNTWSHVVGVRDGNNFKIYFNGILDQEKNTIVDCGINTQPAQDIGDVFVGFGFTGKIDDIIVYDREISQSEVNELFQVGSCCE